MPKRALTLNGAGGGINLDSDLSDLSSTGDSKSDEARESTNLFLDYGGKIIAEYPTVTSNSGVYPVLTTGYTQAKTGAIWALNAAVSDPIAATTYHAGSGSTNNGANVSVVYTTDGSGTPTFYFVNTGEGLVVGNTFQIVEAGASSSLYTITVVKINSFQSDVTEDSALYDTSAQDCLVYNDKLYRAHGVYKHGNYVISSGDANFMSFRPMEGEIGSDAIDANIKYGVDFWLRPDRRPVKTQHFLGTGGSIENWEGGAPSVNVFLGNDCKGWNPQGLGDSSTTGSGVLFDRQVVDAVGHYVGWIAGTNSATASSFDSTFSGPQRDDYMNILPNIMDIKRGLAANTSPANPSVQVVGRKAGDPTGIKFDQTDCGQSVYDGDAADAGLMDFGTNASTHFTQNTTYTDVKLLNDFFYVSVNSDTDWGNDSGGSSRNSNDVNNAANASSFGLIFLVGEWAQASGGSLLNGPWGKFCPSIYGKTMRLEFKISNPSDESKIDNEAMESIYVIAGTTQAAMEFGAIQTDATFDASSANGYKVWEIPRAEILAAQDKNGWAVIEKDVGLPSAQNSNYKGDDKILALTVILVKNATATGDPDDLTSGNDGGSIMLKLKEFSFIEKEITNWKQFDYIRLFQTGIQNGVESMPQPYYTGSYVDGTIANPWIKTVTGAMEGIIRKPHADSVYSGGKVYYSACDEKGVVYGEKYLLCEWDLNQGVSWSGSEDESFQAWGTTGTVPLGVGSDSQSFIFESNPVSTTYVIETGYPANTTSINALWRTATTIGKQVYIGNVAQEKKYHAGMYNEGTGIMHPTVIPPSPSTNAGNGLLAQPFITGTNSTSDRWAFSNSASTITWGTNGANSKWADRGYEVGDSFIVTKGILDVAANENVVFEITAIGTSGSNNNVATVTPAPTDAPDEDGSKIIWAFGNYDKSRILKTTPGSPAGFSDTMYMDLEFGGDEIKVLESVGDRLLIFSKYKLTIVNVASDIDFIEGTFDHMGVLYSKQVCKVGEGVAFVNDSGVFQFNGEEIISLSGEKMKSVSWSTSTSAVAYDAARDLLWVWIGNETIYYYCFGTRSWVGYGSLSDGDFYNLPDTNAVPGNYGLTHYAKGTSASKRHMFLGNHTSIDAALDRDVLWQSGKIDCGNIGSKKIFYDVYVNCVNAGQAVHLQYSLNATTWTTAIVHEYKDQSTNANHGFYDDGETRCGLRTAKGKWIMLRIKDIDTKAKSSMEIGDITLIYRNKLVK